MEIKSIKMKKNLIKSLKDLQEDEQNFALGCLFRKSLDLPTENCSEDDLKMVIALWKMATSFKQLEIKYEKENKEEN